MFKILIIVFVSFLVQMNVSSASEQVLTCGALIETQVSEDKDLCSVEEDCGLKVSKDKYLSPWMELWLNASSLPPTLTFLNGIPTFLNLSSEDVIFSQFEMKDDNLSMVFTTYGGRDPVLVEFEFTAKVQASDIKSSLFFQGTLKAKLTTGEAESLPFACLYQ